MPKLYYASPRDLPLIDNVEQFGVVVKGSLAMVVAGEQRILMVGDTFRIPAGTAHGARVFEEITQVVQVFAPPRTDLPRPGANGAATPP